MSMLRVDAVVDGSQHHVESADDAAGDLDGNRNSLMRKEVGQLSLFYTSYDDSDDCA